MFHDLSVHLSLPHCCFFKWPVNQDLIGQSGLVYERNLLGDLHNSGNLNVIDC